MKPVVVFRHVEHESLGAIEAALDRAGLDFHYIDLFAGAAPSFDPTAAVGLVVLGGPMNVDEIERYPFLAGERRAIRRAIDADLPVLGICLGAQLLASTLGAKVHARPTKEIGWYPLEMTEAAAEDRVLKHLGAGPTVFQWHGDGFELPAGAVSLAGSSLCPQQAFRYGRAAYSLQFHLEVTAAMIDRWLCEPGNCAELSGVPYISGEEIRRRTPVELPRLSELGDRVFDEFAALCCGE